MIPTSKGGIITEISEINGNRPEKTGKELKIIPERVERRERERETEKRHLDIFAFYPFSILVIQER